MTTGLLPVLYGRFDQGYIVRFAGNLQIEATDAFHYTSWLRTYRFQVRWAPGCLTLPPSRLSSSRNATGYSVKFAHAQGGDYMIVGSDANGLPAIFASGQAPDDAGTITQAGANTIADGSMYLSTVAGAGKLFLKVGGTWTDQK